MQIFVPCEDHPQGGFLLGWWLRAPDADNEGDSSVVVSSVVASPSVPCPGVTRDPCLLGELLSQGARSPGRRPQQDTIHRPWITLAQDAADASDAVRRSGNSGNSGMVLRLVRCEVASGDASVSTVQLIRYQTLRTLAPSIPTRSSASSASSGLSGPSRSALRSLPFLAETARPTKISRCLTGLTVLCDWASQISLCLIKPLTRAGFYLGLEERSAFLTHLDVRLHMQMRWAGQLRFLFGQRDVETKWKESTEKDRLLLAFSFVVLCFDAVLGFFVMVLLWCHWPDVLSCLVALGRWAYGKQLAALVPWLMGAPADFKLNRELTSFAGSLFLSIFSLCEIQLPAHVVEALASAAQVFVCCCAMMGASFVLTLLMDILAVASLPLFLAYVGTCLCWKMATRSLYSLCLLFQGWKYNILRSRVDHHNFSLDQLLIGVILLSIVVFLLPSLFVFYTCFAAAWLVVICIHGVLGLLVIWCNYQPFSLLLLLIIAPYYPWHHGLTLTLEMTDTQASTPHAWWRLGVRPPRLVDAMEPLKEAWLEYVQQLLHGAAKAMICGTVWPIRSPLRCSLTLPKAKSLQGQ